MAVKSKQNAYFNVQTSGFFRVSKKVAERHFSESLNKKLSGFFILYVTIVVAVVHLYIHAEYILHKALQRPGVQHVEGGAVIRRAAYVLALERMPHKAFPRHEIHAEHRQRRYLLRRKVGIDVILYAEV